MPRKSWQVDIEGARHTIEFQYGGLMSGRTVSVDGTPVVKTGGNLLEMGSDIPFLVANHWCGIHVRSGALRNAIQLSFDGRSVDTGKPIALLQPIPAWAWFFAVACGFIPVVSLGGAIPVALGLGGAFSCLMLARDPGRTVSLRVAICAAITTLCWVLWGLTIFVLFGAR